MYDDLLRFALPLSAPPVGQGPLWRLTLVDGRTGRTLHLGGTEFAVYTRRPERTEADLMRGRDPLTWFCRVEPVAPGGET